MMGPPRVEAVDRCLVLNAFLCLFFEIDLFFLSTACFESLAFSSFYEMKLCNSGIWNTVETRLTTEKSNARCSSASSASSENSIAMKSSPTYSSLSKMRLCFSLVPAIYPSKHITLLPAMLHVCYLYIPRTSTSRYLQWFPVSLSISLLIQRLFFTISMTYQGFSPPPGACAHMARRNVV